MQYLFARLLHAAGRCSHVFVLPLLLACETYFAMAEDYAMVRGLVCVV